MSVRIQRDWWSKSLAGVLLGLILGLVCSALFMQFAEVEPASVKVQLAMWMVAPIWLAVASGSYLFQTGKQAWVWLCGINLILVGLYLAASKL
ncbi:MAG: hypothetical protein MI756_13305 [Chromatiales bacterium]|nr:hypothetical protein [Chromatiales bacterium]